MAGYLADYLVLREFLRGAPWPDNGSLKVGPVFASILDTLILAEAVVASGANLHFGRSLIDLGNTARTGKVEVSPISLPYSELVRCAWLRQEYELTTREALDVAIASAEDLAFLVKESGTSPGLDAACGAMGVPTWVMDVSAIGKTAFRRRVLSDDVLGVGHSSVAPRVGGQIVGRAARPSH